MTRELARRGLPDRCPGTMHGSGRGRMRLDPLRSAQSKLPNGSSDPGSATWPSCIEIPSGSAPDQCKPHLGGYPSARGRWSTRYTTYAQGSILFEALMVQGADPTGALSTEPGGSARQGGVGGDGWFPQPSTMSAVAVTVSCRTRPMTSEGNLSTPMAVRSMVAVAKNEPARASNSTSVTSTLTGQT